MNSLFEILRSDATFLTAFAAFATFATAIATAISANATKKSASATEKSIEYAKDVRKHVDEIKMLRFRNEMCEFKQECNRLLGLSDLLYQDIHKGYTIGQFASEVQNKPIVITFDRTRWGNEGIAELLLICSDKAKRLGNSNFKIESLYKFISDVYNFKKVLDFSVETLTSAKNGEKKLEDVCKQLEGLIPLAIKNQIKASSLTDMVTVEEYIKWQVYSLMMQYNEIDANLEISFEKENQNTRQ